MLFGAGIALFIAYSQACKNVGLWFIIPACICILLAIPSFLKDLKESKQQSLREKIRYKSPVEYRGTLHDEEWLE